MKLSFIIINYRSREYLEKCISSVFECVQNVGFEIIVVNNDLEKLKCNEKRSDANNKFKNNLKIIEVNENIGFGRGCNVGAKEAKGEILCFLNPDTEIVSKSIDNILKEFESNKEVGVIGSKIIEKNGKVQDWIVGGELTLGKIIKNNIGIISDKKIWNSKEKQDVDWVTGAVLFIRKNLFEKIDGFDKNFFMYFEDIDLCKRVRLEKYKIIYFPNFIVQHLGGGSVKSRKMQKKEYYKSQDYYFEKWFGKKTKNILRFLRKFYF